MDKTQNNDKFILAAKAYREKINTELEKFLNKKILAYKNSDPTVEKNLLVLKEYTMRGGKRIRPLLVLMSYKGLKKTTSAEEKEIIKAAVSIELMESFLLIHDDIMDNDSLRRGGPTVHKVYEKLNNDIALSKREEYGKNMAIILGDLGHSIGTEAILESRFSPEKRIEALKIYQETIKQTCFGQILDIDLGLLHDSKELKSEISKNKISKYWINKKISEIKNMHLMKTAIYSFVAPMKIGYTLAGVGPKRIKEIDNFMIPLGKAFQIKDDILGVFGNSKNTGKSAGSDIREGKITLLILKALEKSEVKTRKKIVSILGKKASKKDLDFVRKIIIDTGSLDYSINLANKYIKEAKKTFKSIKLNKPSKDMFYGLMDFIVSRNK